jgi:hypothetical protein
VSPSTHLVVDESGQGKIVEQICKVLPHIGVAVFPETLVVEPVDLGDLARLVVATENGDPVTVTELEGDEKRDCLNRVVASVDIVTHEEVVRVGRVATDAEELGQIVLLSSALSVIRDGKRGG